jgi:hypothetical protein
MARPRKVTGRHEEREVREPRVVSLLRAAERPPVCDLPQGPTGMRTGVLRHWQADGRAWVELSEAFPVTLACRCAVAVSESDLGATVLVWLEPDWNGVALSRLAAPLPSTGMPTEVSLDGRRVVLEASDEVVLRCGRASIILRRNGRVQIKGAYVETSAEGVNRIKGGTVQIN